MAIATTSAARPGSSRAPPSCTATAVPTRTGDTLAASVAGRAASHQMRPGLRALREPGEVRLALVDVGVAALLRLLAHVVEERGITGQLLDARQPVVGGVHAALDHAQRQRAVLEHAAAPLHGLPLQVGQGHHLVDEAHLERLLGVVLLAQEPDLARLLLAHDSGQQARTVAAVEAADPRPRLSEARVVGGDGEVADHMQDVGAADRRGGWLRVSPSACRRVGRIVSSGTQASGGSPSMKMAASATWAARSIRVRSSGGGGDGRLSMIGVSTAPGLRTEKRTPSACSSRPAARANPIRPALVAWQAGPLRSGHWPEMVAPSRT